MRFFLLTKRHWRTLFLGCASLSLALAFNLASHQDLRQPSPPAQAIAVAPALTAEQLNQQLLAVLPPLEAADPVAAPNSPVAAIANSSSPQPSAALDSPAFAFPAVAAPLVPSPVPAPVPAAFPAAPVGEAIALTSRRPPTQYGHFPYAEAYPEQLVIAGSYGSRPEQLHIDAANAFQQMVAAARRDGLGLIPVSGFRDRGIQAELFAAQTARQGSPERAARISAPPGHSEHHTGYAIDMGDEGSPSTDLDVSFDQTLAFRWLTQHGADYGFELSFPRDNAQGISYEPWHWRFVGNAQAQQVFAQAR